MTHSKCDDDYGVLTTSDPPDLIAVLESEINEQKQNKGERRMSAGSVGSEFILMCHPGYEIVSVDQAV